MKSNCNIVEGLNESRNVEYDGKTVRDFKELEVFIKNI